MSSLHGFSGDQIRSIVERIEKLEEQKAAITEDIKEVYGEAKAFGFDTKTLRTIVRLRKLDLEQLQEQDEMVRIYREALGMGEKEELAHEDHPPLSTAV